MLNNKFLQLLSTLDKRELTRFQDFVQSPYFNKHIKVKELYDLLLPLGPNFDHPRKLNKEALFYKLYPSDEFDDNFFASLVSKLQNLLYEFLAIEQFREEEIKEQLNCLAAIREKKADKHYDFLLKKVRKQLQKPLYSSEEQASLEAAFQQESDLWFMEGGGRSYHPALQLYSNALDAQFIIKKLRLACDMLTRNKLLGVDYQPHLLPILIKQLNEQASIKETYPIIPLYLKALDLIQDKENELNYRAFKMILHHNEEKLKMEELKQLYDYALNYCVEKINEGKSSYYQEILDLYQQLLKKGLLHIDGYLPDWEYKNMVTSALRIQNFEWCKDFIESYRTQLSPRLRENAYSYNKASYYYATQQQSKALQTLMFIEFTNRTYYLGAKIIQLKSYYELREWEALGALFDAFMAFLRRQKDLGSYRKQANQHLVRVSKALARLRSEMDWQSDAKIKAQLQKTEQLMKDLSPIASKEWLNKELDKIKQELGWTQKN